RGGSRAGRSGAAPRAPRRPGPLRCEPRAVAPGGRTDPGILPRPARGLHRARARLSRRGSRADEPRAELVHARDRERHRAGAAGGRGDGRARHAAADHRAALQQPGRLPGHRAGPGCRGTRRHPCDRRDRDASAPPVVPALAALPGTPALSGTRVVTVVSVHDLTLRFGERVLWESLSFELEAGELLAVLGPNGTGKTSLIRILLGLLEPSAGRVTVNGRAPRELRSRIGYVPQQRIFDRDLALRGRDLVRLGLDGHRWGMGWLEPAARARIDRALEEVGAAGYADAPIGRLSGGEQQRLRVAQALVSDPALLLADEPLLSLDLAYQQVITGLLDAHRRAAGTPVVRSEERRVGTHDGRRGGP